LAIAFAQMLTCAIVNGLASARKTQRRIDRHQLGIRLLDRVENVLVIMCDLCSRS
jgi:hypothetical protein